MSVQYKEPDQRIAELTAERDRLRAALKWFADPFNYEDTETRVAYLKGNIVWSEGISRAREALEGGKP